MEIKMYLIYHEINCRNRKVDFRYDGILIRLLTLESQLTVLCIFWTNPELHREVWKEASVASCNSATVLQLRECEADVASVYTHCQQSTVIRHQDMKTRPAILQQRKRISNLNLKCKLRNFSSKYFQPTSMEMGLSSEANGHSDRHFSYFIWNNRLTSMGL